MPKINELPSATTPLAAADILLTLQGGVTKQVPVSGLPTPTSSPFGTMLVPLSSGTGASDSAKFRYFCDNYATLGRPIVVVPSGTTLDSGANNPFVLPTGFHFMCVPSSVDEFGYQGIINLRHTGSTTTLGTLKMAPGPSKGQKITGVSFKGTSSTRAFVSTATDASDNAYWQYVHLHNVSFDQFESVFEGTGTGIIWDGVAFINNMNASRNPFTICGSDHFILMGGGFMEMGTVSSYATRAALSAMIKLSNTNCTVGPIYTTGSPTTPFLLDSSPKTGVNFIGPTLEGRPSPGTVGGDTPTDGLHCAGPLMRLNNGRATVHARHHAYAMRDPRSSVLGYVPGGFYHVTGTSDLAVVGGTFQPYVATDYPAWTRPDGVAYPVDTQPPLAWVSGANARASFSNIVRGANCASIPVVYAHNGATVVADGTVQVITV